jgi:hypothetical protein
MVWPADGGRGTEKEALCHWAGGQGPAPWQGGAKNTACRCLFPAHHNANAVDRQSKQRRESERPALFAVAGELLSRGKTQAEFSALSCFLGLAPSFLPGGLAALFSFPAAPLRL